MDTNQAITVTLGRLRKLWCGPECGNHDDLSDCDLLLYGLFQDDPEVSDLMLGFPLGLS